MKCEAWDMDKGKQCGNKPTHQCDTCGEYICNKCLKIFGYEHDCECSPLFRKIKKAKIKARG